MDVVCTVPMMPNVDVGVSDGVLIRGVVEVVSIDVVAGSALQTSNVYLKQTNYVFWVTSFIYSSLTWKMTQAVFVKPFINLEFV